MATADTTNPERPAGAAAGCSCALQTMDPPTPRKYHRVRRGMLWVDELVPLQLVRAAACGDTPCEPCKAKREAEARRLALLAGLPEGSSSPIYPSPAAAASGSDMPSVVTDPAAWLKRWQEKMRAAEKVRAAARAAGTEPDPYEWFNESEALRDRRRVLEERDRTNAINPDTTPEENAALADDWSRLSTARKREIATALANSATRDQTERARLIHTALTQGIASLNRILEGEYGIVMARINSQRDIELARINARGQTERLLLTQAQQQTLAAQTPSGNNAAPDNSMIMIVVVIAVVAAMMAKKRG